MSILTEAEGLVLGERQKAYGPPGPEFERIAAAWTALLSPKLSLGAVVTSREVALAMAILKIIRESHKPNSDNRRDAAGYMLVADIVSRETGTSGASQAEGMKK